MHHQLRFLDPEILREATHLWIWRRQDPGNFNLIDLSCLDCLLVKIDFAAGMKIATRQNFWSERLILSLKKITTKFLLNWILVFMLVKISWLGTFDMFYMIHKLHLEVERKFDKYKAVYFFVFAFDKDNTVYFPAGGPTVWRQLRAAILKTTRDN